MNPGLDKIQGYGWTLYPARGHNVPPALSQILGTTGCNENQDAPLLIHKESGYEISSMIQMVMNAWDIGTLQHFLLLVKFHQKDKFEIAVILEVLNHQK
jgi:hypothetical protein